MADNINKKITIDVEMDTAELTKTIGELNEHLDELLKKQKSAGESGKESTKSFKDIADQVKQTQTAIDTLTKSVDSNTKAFTNHKKTIDDNKDALSENIKTYLSSNSELQKNKAHLEILKQRYDDVSASFGDNSKSAKALNQEIGTLSSTITRQQEKIDKSRTVFDGHKAANDSFKNSFESIKKASGEFAPALEDTSKGFEALKTALSAAKTGFSGVGEAIKTTGLGLLMLVLQSLVDYFTKTKEGTRMLTGGLSAIKKVVDIVHQAFASFGKVIIDAVTHPVESFKKLGAVIVENILNRFDAIRVILDGIIHLDFRKIADGFVQSVTGVTHATDRMVKSFDGLKSAAVNNWKQINKAYDEGVEQAIKAEKKLKKHKPDKSPDKITQQNSVNAEMEKSIKDSIARQLQLKYEAYGNEAIAENNRYKQELDKLKEQAKNKLITKQQYAEASKQLEIVHQDNVAAIIAKYNRQDKEKTEAAQKELFELEVRGMKEGVDKQTAELKLQLKERNEQLEKADEAYLDRKQKLEKEISDAKAANPDADTGALQTLLDAQEKLLEINAQKRKLIAQQTADAINKIKADARQKELMENDQAAVDTAKGAAAKLEAEKKSLLDKYTFEFAQAQGNAAKLTALKARYEQEITALTKKAEQERKDFSVQIANDVAKTAFTIISGNIRSSSEAKIKGLEKDKAAELNNKNLTASQRAAIEARYKKKENDVKTKAFKDEQKVSVAQALINGALAITKAEAQTGVLGAFAIPLVIAKTALQVATIVAQKPPQYAKGGLHYQSDGKGALLPGYSRNDNTNAYLRSGEAIVVSEAMRDPWARNLVSAINVAYGGRDFAMTNPTRGYAIGGIFTDGGNSNRYYNQPVNDQKNLANTIAYQMINNFPPIYVDVKDINNQQNILAQTTNRVNL